MESGTVCKHYYTFLLDLLTVVLKRRARTQVIKYYYFLQVINMMTIVIVASLFSMGQHEIQAQTVERPYIRTNLTLRLVIRYPEILLTVSRLELSSRLYLDS